MKEDSLQGKNPWTIWFLKCDGSENFAYMCFLTSDYLTEKVTPERVGFNIYETVEGLFADDEISFAEIRDNALKIITEYLDQYLTDNKNKLE